MLLCKLKVLVDILGLLALAVLNLDLEHLNRKREQRRAKIEQKVQSASSAAMTAQGSALAMAGEV